MRNRHIQPFTDFLFLRRQDATEYWIYSGIPAVIHVRLPPSSPLSSPPRILARPESGGIRVTETQNRISLARITVKPLVQSPLNDNNFAKFMRGTGQGYKFYLHFLLKMRKIFMLLR